MMGNNNKILTVSYGTFSCTLEGFEDSFDTMKAIAEYFRDLAAEDRFFGAVPPTPDAAVMATIAERETSRRVAAHQEDGQIVLRAQEAQTEASAPAAQVPPAQTSQIAQVAPVVTGVAAAVATQEAASAPASSIAERLQRIRAVVNGAGDAAEARQDYSEDEHSDQFRAPQQDEETKKFAPSNDSFEADAEPEAFEEEFVEDSAADLGSTADDEFEPTDESEEPQEPIAETENFEEPVVATDDFEDAVGSDAGFVEAHEDEDVLVSPAEDIDLADDETATAAPEAIFDEVSEDNLEDAADAEQLTADTADLAALEDFAEPTSDEIEDAADEVQLEEFEEDYAAEVEPEPAAETQELEEVVAEDIVEAPEVEDTAAQTQPSEIEAALAALAASEDEEVEAPAAEDIPASEDIAEDSIAAMMASFDDEDATDAVVSDPETVEDAEEDAKEDNLFEASEDLKAEVFEEEEPETVPEPAPEAQDRPLRRTRVIKVKRADIERAVAEGRIEETTPAEVSSLSEEDEAELLADLARAEADESGDGTLEEMAGADTLVLGADDLVRDDVTEQDDIAQEESVQEEPLEEEPVEEEPAAQTFETDVNRLMEKTDEEMHEPESAKRRSAFQALKAAVAARKADKGLEAEEQRRRDSGAYRSDLAEVVQPRRPETPETTEERPSARPAPLRLVAEQRVDVDGGEPEEPVRPRRVAASDTPASEAGDFAQYASEKGATDLSDLLEAAASYLVFVEGKEQFSRPQLMTKVRQVEVDGFSREDGLRSFGQLLRTGKIEKVAGGRFAVTSEIGYRPDQREAG